MRKSYLSITNILIIIFLFLPIIATAMQAQEPKLTKSDNVTFVMTADHGELTNHTDKNRAELMLSNIQGDVMYFSDRPVRKVGVLDIEAFAHFWKKYFASCVRLDGHIPAIIEVKNTKNKENINIEITKELNMQNGNVKFILEHRNKTYLDSPCGRLIINVNNLKTAN